MPIKLTSIHPIPTPLALNDSSLYASKDVIKEVGYSVRSIQLKLRRDGWVELRQRGSHQIWGKQGIPENISLPVHNSRDVSPGVVRSTAKLMGMTLEEFHKL